MMFEDLRLRANQALSSICEENVPSPLVADDAGYLNFFTKVVSCLEGGAGKARRLVEERSHDLLARAFSLVFSHLLCSDPDFDFEAAIAPIPGAIQGAWRAGWRIMWTT